jgi:hypothetical protein
MDAELTQADDDHAAVVNTDTVWMPFIWSRPDVGSGLSNEAIGVGGGSDANSAELILPWNVSIIALSAIVENARTAGSATFKVSKDGSPIASVQVVIDASNTQQIAVTFQSGLYVVQAGERIGAMISSTGDWAAGVTPSAVVLAIAEMSLA